MSRSYKKIARGNRHLSEKKDKIFCSKSGRRTNKTILKDLESDKETKEFLNPKEAYPISWYGQKEGSRSYQDIRDAREYVIKSIDDAINSVFFDRYYNSYDYSFDDKGNMIKIKKRYIIKKKPWSKVKKWMFHTWNEKILSILEITKPKDLYNVKEENIEKAAQLLHKNWNLMK